MDQSENNELQNLYDEFVSEIVKSGNSEAFFDENDLVEVFDRASDVDNSIVKMEVLLYGERHYPGSEALATRRAWFYSEFGDMDAAATVNRRVAHEGVLNKLLNLHIKEETDVAIITRELARLIKEADRFTEEDLIQLADYCADVNLLEWVHERRDAILAKTEFDQTFIYELAQLYEESGEFEKAAKLYEELTMLDPFLLDFWVRLAGAQYSIPDYEAALSTSEYALAIDHESPEAIRLKCGALHHLGRSPEVVIALLTKLASRPDASDMDITLLASSLADNGHHEEAKELLLSHFDSKAPTVEMIDVMFGVSPGDAERYLNAYLSTTEISAREALEWAQRNAVAGQTNAAIAILEKMSVKEGMFDYTFPPLMYLLYTTGEYEKVKNTCLNAYKSNPETFLGSSLIGIVYIMSVVRTSPTAVSIETINKFIEENRETAFIMLMRGDMPNGEKIEFCTMLKGYFEILRDIRSKLSRMRTLDPDSFDPLRGNIQI